MLTRTDFSTIHNNFGRVVVQDMRFKTSITKGRTLAVLNTPKEAEMYINILIKEGNK